MKKFSILFLLIPLMVLFSSCKQSQIKKLENFTSEVSAQYSGYSNSDLEKAQARFEKLLLNAEKNELTGEEQRHINELKGQCKGYFAQAKARLLLEEFNAAVDEAGDEVRGALKSLQEEE